jgi:O-antigen/teichoic acid export membrane protein
MSQAVQGEMARGALWMVLFKLLERGLGLISTLILVRLLSPADFGIVAMATSFIFMAELLAAFGFDVALIQKQDATDQHYHTAWTCNVLLGLLITLAMLMAAAPIAGFYSRPEVFWVVFALALGPLLSGCENIGVIAFRKELQFRREFFFQLSRKVIGFLVVVPSAYLFESYWALVAGMLISKLAGTVISYLAHPFRPRFSLATLRGLLGFSKWLLFNNMVGFLKERSSDFAIGRLHGAAPLGVYNVSYEFASMPTTELSAPINRALMPGFARIAGDAAAMRDAYTNAIGMLALLAVPAATGIFAVAHFLVPVVLGTKWLEAVLLIEILAPNGGLLLFHSSICAVLIANGYPERVTITNGLYVVMLLVLLVGLAPGFGVSGAAVAALGASVFSTPIYLLQVRRSIGITTTVFIRAAARPMMAALTMAGLVRWFLPDWSITMSVAVAAGWLVSGVMFGVVAYAAIVFLLWLAVGRPAGAEQLLLERARQLLARRRAALALP